MRTKIQFVTRAITRQQGIERFRDERGEVVSESPLMVTLHEKGFAEVNYAGSVISPIVATLGEALTARSERIKRQQEKHARSLYRNFIRLDRLHAAPLSSRPTSDWNERRQAFVAKP